MQIFNRSSIHCDNALWHAVAKALDLSGRIKGAKPVGRKILVVMIHKEKRRIGKENSLYGDSIPGRIDLYPCRVCTFGTMTLAFLREIAYVWLYDFRDDLLLEEGDVDFCEAFAQRAYQLLKWSIPS